MTVNSTNLEIIYYFLKSKNEIEHPDRSKGLEINSELLHFYYLDVELFKILISNISYINNKYEENTN